MSQREPTPHLKDLNRIIDSRGFFSELIKSTKLAPNEQFQLNHSRSLKGVLRGLHFTNRPSSKSIVCIRGSIQGVIVNLSRNQDCFGQVTHYQLDDKSSEMFFVPPNYAHGFQVLSELADIIYFTDSIYSPQDDHAINALDPSLNINWDQTNLIRSTRDINAMGWTEYVNSRDLPL